MKTENAKPLGTDLSFFEKFVLNTIFVIILCYIFSITHFNRFLIMNDLKTGATTISFFLIFVFFVLRILLLLDKSALKQEGKTLWCFYKGFKKHSFEIDEISSIRKSRSGLYSSFVVKVQNKKIRIPAETVKLGEFISGLSQHLSKEQAEDLQNFHKRALFVCFEMEKRSKFLRIFCFFIPPLAFFIAGNVWESFSMIICLLWAFLSLVFPLFWTIIHWLLLKISVRWFSVFSRISTLWTIFGVLLYMVMGIAYRKFYLWLIYYYRN